MTSKGNRHSHDCCEFPDLKRPNYFFGQMLGVREFRGEQSYFREKFKLLNRTLHGYGVVCGLLVAPDNGDPGCGPSKPSRERERLEKEIAALEELLRFDSTSAAEAEKIRERIETLRRELEDLPPGECVPEPSPKLRIDCGFALDCEGNELILHRPVEVDPLDHLDDDERKSDIARTLYVTICYCAKPIEPSRPLQTQECGITSDCEYGWTLDTVSVHVTTTRPKDKQKCDPCCECRESCLLLATIENFVPGRPIQPEDIHNGVRRMLSVYDFVRISGVNWVHGGTYTSDQALRLLGADDGESPRGGLQIQLTRDIGVSSLKPGVLDVWILEGGDGLSGDVNHVAGDFDLPATPYTDLITWQQRSGENLQDGDCVLVSLRCEFLLDRCCRAVDGSHIGGRVPLLPDSIDVDVPALEHCRQPARYPGPWQSGNQSEGSNFVSWFYVRREDSKKGRKA
jgi:hypothetical protein